MKKYFQLPFIRFLLLAFGLFVAWQLAYELWLHPKLNIDKYVITNINYISSHILLLCGYNLLPESFAHIDVRTVGVDGGHELWIGDSCSGLELFVLFAIFIIAFSGPLIRKVWFIPLGIVIIHGFNILRVIALVLMTVYFPVEYLDFNHTYTFTIITYSCILFLWYIWVAKLSGRK